MTVFTSKQPQITDTDYLFLLRLCFFVYSDRLVLVHMSEKLKQYNKERNCRDDKPLMLNDGMYFVDVRAAAQCFLSPIRFAAEDKVN